MEAYLKRIRDSGDITAAVICPETVKTAPMEYIEILRSKGDRPQFFGLLLVE